jgi:hypothetical protein
MEVVFNQGTKQKVFPASEVEVWMAKGWAWKGNLGNGRAVLEPANELQYAKVGSAVETRFQVEKLPLEAWGRFSNPYGLRMEQTYRNSSVFRQ